MPKFDSDATSLPGSSDPETTQLPGHDPLADTQDAPLANPERRVLGVIGVYSKTAEDSETIQSELGRTYPMREGDVFFVGKPPAQEVLEVEGGRRLSVTQTHILTNDEEFLYVSRRHLAIEFEEGGKFTLFDFSTNGIFLVEQNRHVRRSGNQSVARHVIEGAETLVLGIDLNAMNDKTSRQRARRSEIQVRPLVGGGTCSSEVTRP